jgi:hypothetical protein
MAGQDIRQLPLQAACPHEITVTVGGVDCAHQCSPAPDAKAEGIIHF